MDIRPFDPTVHKPRKNPDGSFSTELLRTVKVGKDWANVPSLWFDKNGQPVDLGHLNDDELAGVASEFESGASRRFPRFSDTQSAEEWARSRSGDGGANQGQLSMTILEGLRQRYPQYDDLSDGDLADRFYSKFYSDMDRAAFDAKIGLKAAAPTSAPTALADATGMPTEEPDDPVASRGVILPIGRTESGEKVFTLPEFLHRPFEIIKDIMDGKRTHENLTPQDYIDVGMLFGGLGAGAGQGPAISRLAGNGAAPKTGNVVTEAGKRIGVDVPRAVASDSSTVRQVGKVVQAVPGGGQPMRKASEAALRQLGDAATRVEESLGAGSAPRAGNVIDQGITAFAGKGGILAERAGARLDRVDAMVNPATMNKLTQTGAAASKIMERRKNAAITEKSGAVQRIEAAISRPEGLNYQGLKDLRTFIGELVDNPSLLPSDISGAELKQIYAALTTDLKAEVKAGGGEKALKAWEIANTAFEKSMEVRKNLARVLKANSDEGIFAKIEGMAGSTARADLKTLAQVRAAVGKENWGEVSSAFVARLGRDAEGKFSPERFLTSWGKISPDAKRILFDTAMDKKLSQALDDIATVSSKFKSLREFANPSGTGQTVVGAALGAGGVASLFGSVTAPLTVGGTILGARVLSNVLAKPQTAVPFASWAKAYGAFVNHPTSQGAQALRLSARALALSLVNDGSVGEEERDQLATAFASIKQGA